MTLKILFLALLIPFLPLFAIAQTQLSILDGVDKSPLPGANVQDINSGEVWVSDENGMIEASFSFPLSLEVSFVGYETKNVYYRNSREVGPILLRTEEVLLDNIVVTGFETNRNLLETPAAIAVISAAEINRVTETSIVPAMNTIPGVRMEERSPGSYRISIRGSALRSPFDVRNIKIYWNGIPFTEPGGNTPFNQLDPLNMGTIEILKGPSGSIFGAGIGGVVNIKSRQANFNESMAEIGYTFGSFGMKRFTASVQTGGEKSLVSFQYANQQSDGYRDHSAFQRKTYELSTKFFPSEKREISASLFYSDLFYEIPGGLTQEQVDENPRQARPGNPFTLGSEEANASIDVESFMMVLSQDYNFNDRFSNETSVYTILSDFINPFNLDYKREAQQGFGGRTVWEYNASLFNFPTQITFGGEYQSRFAAARNYGNVGGMPDTLNFDDELRTSQALVFAQAGFDLPADFNLSLGLSYNLTNYDILRLVDATLNRGYDIERKFDPVLAPRMALLKKLNPTNSIFGSISYGFSPPTLEEVRTNEGSINTDINPEVGLNYELGARGMAANNRLDYDVTAFLFNLKETIIDYQSERGTTLFRNAGQTDQKGVEAGVGYSLISNPGGGLSLLSIRSSYTYHRFRFEEYKRGENDFSGNKLTGVAPHNFVARISAETGPGFYSNIQYSYTDEIPLNDANSVYAPDYHLVMFKAGFRKTILGQWQLDLYVGGDNLLDENYSLGNDLNAFGGRHFQPSASRNFYAGMKVNYQF